MKKSVILIIILFCSLLNAGNVLSAPDTWTQKTDLGGSGRYSSAGFSIGSKGYIGTGVINNNNYNNCGCFSNGSSITCISCYMETYDLADFWEYDSTSDTWTQKADFGGGTRDFAVGFSIGGKGYMGTGEGELYPYYKNDFWEYDPASNTWTQKADFGGTARAAAAGFSIGSKGYIGTGDTFDSVGHNIKLKDFWEYDPASDTWTQKADLGGAARGEATGFSIGGKGYIGTGTTVDSSGAFVNSNDFWEYDPVSNIWTQKADFGGTARNGAVGLSIGSKGYIGTGFDSSTQKDFWEFEPATNTWTQRVDFGGTAREDAVAFSIGNAGYVTTGFLNFYNKQDLWEYDAFDTTPDQFAFTNKTNVSLNATITSNSITVSGINSAAGISITGGSYSVNGGSYTSTGGTVNNGDTVKVQLTSSGSYSTTTNATLTIGGVSDTFSVTTQVAPARSGGGGSSGCFIATAAFGSPMAGQVEILRQFRDRYLLTNELGRKFVVWYYRNSPVAANYIKDKPLAKAAVRLALYPLIGFSLLLIFGYLPFVIVGLLLFTLLSLRLRPKKLSAT
jgi:N-acetylneuraminic acid mutarotase